MWRFGFFDSVEVEPGVHDRVYNAEEFSVPVRALIDTGVLEGAGDSLEVTADGSTMKTTIGSGVAFINGRFAENTSTKSHTHDTEAVGVDRIDRIVIRLDLRPEARSIDSFVKKGVASTNPAPPALQRDENVYEISLAQVYIRGGQSFIDPADITDERGDEDVCPWARSKVLPHVDAEDVIELRNEFDQFKVEFTDYKDRFDETVQQPIEIVTVGTGGDFATINEAIEYLSKKHARYWPDGYTAEIRLLSGFVMQEQVFVEGINLGWITITSEDSEVTIRRASLLKQTPSLDLPILGFRKPAFFGYKNAVLPTIGTIFTMDTTFDNEGRGYDWRDGIVISHNSRIVINRQCGIKNVSPDSTYGSSTPYGLLAVNGSIATIEEAIFSGSAIGIGVYNGSIVSARNTDLSNCAIKPGDVSRSHLYAQHSNMTGGGWEGLLVYDGSYVNIESVNLSGAGGDGLIVFNGSVVNADGADISGTSGSNSVRIINGCVVNLSNANCRKGTSDSPDDIYVLGGCIVTIRFAQGGTNIATNTLTSNGIIFTG